MVGCVIKGSVEGIMVGEAVVSSVNECEGRLLVVMGETVEGATVLSCVDGCVVGAGASEKRNNII